MTESVTRAVRTTSLPERDTREAAPVGSAATASLDDGRGAETGVHEIRSAPADAVDEPSRDCDRAWRSDQPLPRLLAVRGVSGSGKTTLIEALIPRLIELGIRVGTIKHAHHGAALDVPGKDSHRHAMAGATCVLLLGPGQAGFFVPREADPDPGSWLEYFAGRVDLVLVEGFSRAAIPCVSIEISDISRIDLDESSGGNGPRWTFRSPRRVSAVYARMVERLARSVVLRMGSL